MSNLVALNFKALNTVTINTTRLNHLLKLFRLSKDDILSHVNKGIKKKYVEEDIFNQQVKVSVLKKVDSIFNKGINYYLDPKMLKESKEESIFFRKDKFNAELSLGAKQIVNYFEQEKISISALSKLSNLTIERVLPFYSIRNSAKKAASEIRKILYTEFHKDRKEFLKSLIAKLAENNILVFEFVETWNKKERANISGFYLSPNVIVLRRNQKSLRREIFTLVHELGHYLLNEEEIDPKTVEDFSNYDSSSAIERWCNDFAYYFLAGDYDSQIANLDQATARNNFHRAILEEVSGNTNLSTLAIYTRFLLDNKISQSGYNKVRQDILESIERRKEEERHKWEREKQKAEQEGRKLKGSTPKPILSPLYVRTVQSAFFEGIINEVEFCRRLNIKANKIESYLQ